MCQDVAPCVIAGGGGAVRTVPIAARSEEPM